MNESTEETVRPSPEPLYRPVDGRIISGTALGLARKLGLPPILIRIAFALLAFSGTGIALYIVCWLLIPGEGDSESIGQRWLARMSGSQAWFGVVLVVVAAAILASAIPFFDGGIVIPIVLLVVGILLYRGEFGSAPAGPPTPPPTAFGPASPPPVATTMTTPRPTPPKPSPPSSPLGQITIGVVIISLGSLALIDRLSSLVDAGPRHYLALAATVIGIGVLVGTRYGRARWLIPFGLLLIPMAVGAGWSEFYRTAGTQTISPASFADLENTYELSAGRLVIDLRELAWEGEAVEIDGSVGLGTLELLLPADVGVEARTEVGIGASVGPETTRGGLGVDYSYGYPGAGAGLVTTHLEVGIGEIVVNGIDPGGQAPFATEPGDVIIAPSEPSALAPSYTVDGDDNLKIDLSALSITRDVRLELSAEDGTLSVVLPADVSYIFEAHSVDGSIDLLGNTTEAGGTIISQSETGGNTIFINAFTDEGAIVVTKDGGRS